MAQEDYVRCISKLGSGIEPVTVSAVAASMGVTAPSASGMIQRLEGEGLVQHRPRGNIKLTRAGESLAMSIHRRHRLIETFLVNVLDLDWSEVHQEAEALEHHLSDRLVQAFDRYLGYPKTDPHGHPIPASDGSVITRDLCALESLEDGERAVIREVGSDAPERIRRWKELGLVPGAAIHLKKRRPVEGVWILDVEGKEVITGFQGITGLLVEKIT